MEGPRRASRKMAAMERTNARTMMAGKKRHRISKRAVEQRRERVGELRVAGLWPADIVEELRKEEVFSHTTEEMVWKDIKALDKRAKLERIEAGAIVKEILQKSRGSISVVSSATHRRFIWINAEIDRAQELIAEVDSLLQDHEQPVSSRGRLMAQYDLLVSSARKLRREARAEMRLIISISETMIRIPRKLGLLSERRDVGLYDEMKETMVDAIKNEPDPERRRKLIEAAETLAGLL